MVSVPRKNRAILALALMMVIPALPAAGTGPGEGPAAPREVINDANDLIVPEGWSIELCGCHTYVRSVQILGTLKVIPWGFPRDGAGTLAICAPYIYIAPGGLILADGRGYGGGGGGSDNIHPDIPVPGGYGGVNGVGGEGASLPPNLYDAGSGGGGSNGGKPGAGRALGGFGTETGGGDGGGPVWGLEGGKGGSGFGGGGGGGASNRVYDGGGGGGGGGSGGENGNLSTGGAGAGPFAGLSGLNGGYLFNNSNGDTTLDDSVFMGSGGGGGSSGGSAGGGGGAGGGAVTIHADGDLDIRGYIGATGGGGGATSGGGGAGGGILLRGINVSVSGTVDARGRDHDTLSTQNGGTVKLLHTRVLNVSGNVLAGRIQYDSLPIMHGLVSPSNGSWASAKPTFSWNPATDSDETDTITYQLQVAANASFPDKQWAVMVTNITGTAHRITIQLTGDEYYWRVRACDSYGPGEWSEARRILVDRYPPVSRVGSLPTYSTVRFTVSWSATDIGTGIANFTILVSEDGEPFQTWLDGTESLSANFTGKDNHTYRFRSLAMDISENREQGSSAPNAITTVDAVAPYSEVGPLVPFQTALSFQVSWSGRDAVSGMERFDIFVSVDSGPFGPWLVDVPYDVESALFSGSDGHSYRFYCIATDGAGNRQKLPEAGLFRTTLVDVSVPVTAFVTAAPSYGTAPVYVAPATMLSFRSTDTGAGVNATRYFIDDRPPADYTGPFTETQNGSHNLTYWTVDRAGNAEARRTAWFFVDAEPPATTLSFIGANLTSDTGVSVGSRTRIVLSGSDGGSGMNRTLYDIDATGWRTYNGSFDLTLAGTHTLQYRSMDNLGQAEPLRSVTIVADLSAPVSEATPDSFVSNRDIGISFSGQDAENEVSAIFYRVVKSGAPAPVFRAGNGTVVKAHADHSLDGVYTIEYYGVDNLGNTEGIKNISVIIDTIVHLALDWTPDSTVQSDTFVLTGRAEPGSLVVINKKKVMLSEDGNFSCRIHLVEGKNRIAVNATDPAGNSVELTGHIVYENPSAWKGPLLQSIITAIALFTAAAGFITYRCGRKKR